MITPNYSSYLVRIWQEDKAKNGSWLASLEDIRTRRLTYFKSMEELSLFFKNVYEKDMNSSANSNEPDQ